MYSVIQRSIHFLLLHLHLALLLYFHLPLYLHNPLHISIPIPSRSFSFQQIAYISSIQLSTLLRSSYNNIHHSPLLHTLIHSIPPLLIYLYSSSHILISPTAYTTPVYLQQILAPHVRNAIQATTPRLATIYLFFSISLFLSLSLSHPLPRTAVSSNTTLHRYTYNNF